MAPQASSWRRWRGCCAWAHHDTAAAPASGGARSAAPRSSWPARLPQAPIQSGPRGRAPPKPHRPAVVTITPIPNPRRCPRPSAIGSTEPRMTATIAPPARAMVPARDVSDRRPYAEGVGRPAPLGATPTRLPPIARPTVAESR